MKTIAMFRRYGSDNSRLYQLPDGTEIKPGTIVTVDFMGSGSTATAYAVSRSYTVDDAQLEMIADFLHIRNFDSFKRVRSIYSEDPVEYADEQEEQEEPEEPEECEGEG